MYKNVDYAKVICKVLGWFESTNVANYAGIVA